MGTNAHASRRDGSASTPVAVHDGASMGQSVELKQRLLLNIYDQDRQHTCRSFSPALVFTLGVLTGIVVALLVSGLIH